MMTFRIGFGIGCRFVIQLVCFYMIIHALNGSVTGLVFVVWAIFMSYSKYRSTKNDISNDVEDFFSEYQAYPLKKMSKEAFERSFEVLDQERAVYVKKPHPLLGMILSRLYYVVAKEELQGEVSFHETYYDYL